MQVGLTKGKQIRICCDRKENRRKGPKTASQTEKKKHTDRVDKGEESNKTPKVVRSPTQLSIGRLKTLIRINREKRDWVTPENYLRNRAGRSIYHRI